MVTTSKDSFATSQTLRILNSLKDWVQVVMDFKREALKGLILLFALWGGR